MPVEVGADARLAPFIAAGREIFTRRQGQLNLACTHCHDDQWGKRLAGAAIPQGHPNGYPIYRLEWQSLGLAAAAAAQLPGRDAVRALCL